MRTAMEDQQEISLSGVTKIFKTGVFRTKTAVSDVSFRIPPGEVVGLLGANGSGKSTTLKMILGFLYPTSGKITVCGLSAGTTQARRLIGYLPENPRFQKFLTATQVLNYYGKLLDLTGAECRAKAPVLLDLVGLAGAANERVGNFSKGMTQRLAIAQALLNNPKLLIFDEPMSGLDPLGRVEIRKLIGRIHDEMPHATLLFSSHVLADVEELCSSVAVLKAGRLQNYCRIADLMTPEGSRYYVTASGVPTAIAERYVQFNQGKPHPLGLSFFVDTPESLVVCLKELNEAGASLVSLSSLRQKLEQALFADKGRLSVNLERGV